MNSRGIRRAVRTGSADLGAGFRCCWPAASPSRYRRGSPSVPRRPPTAPQSDWPARRSGWGRPHDAFGLTIPMMFYGSIVPDGDAFHTVPYPAQISISIPIISDLPGLSDLPYWTQSLKRSEAIGAGYLLQDIAATASDDTVKIIGVSQGTQVAEIARTEMCQGYGIHRQRRRLRVRLHRGPVSAQRRHPLPPGLLERCAGARRHLPVRPPRANRQPLQNHLLPESI